MTLGYRATGTLVLEISPYISYLAMYPTYLHSLLHSVASTFRPLTETALNLFQLPFILFHYLLVLDNFTIAMRSKGLQTNVNADELIDATLLKNLYQ